MKERQPDVSEKVKPSSEILYKKLEEGYISMVCIRTYVVYILRYGIEGPATIIHIASPTSDVK